MNQSEVMMQVAPYPVDLEAAVNELNYLPEWKFWLSDENRGQGCIGMTLNIVPNKPDSYHPEKHARTRFLYPVPSVAFNRESWEEWLWARIEETEGHERAEWFGFIGEDGEKRRPFKPAHPDGWDPGVIRSVVSESVVNTPNAGRLVKFPCNVCGHNHFGKMGEHFTIIEDRGCALTECNCGKANDEADEGSN
jgi:hypothetical protein